MREILPLSWLAQGVSVLCNYCQSNGWDTASFSTFNLYVPDYL